MTSPVVAPFVLTPRLVAEKALPLLIAGKLQAQLHSIVGGCSYRRAVDGSPCVIGAALPDALAWLLDTQKLQSLRSLTNLDGSGELVCMPSDSDRETLCAWQYMHDGGRIDQLRAALEAELAKGA